MKPVCHWTASSFNGWDMLLNLKKIKQPSRNKQIDISIYWKLCLPGVDLVQTVPFPVIGRHLNLCFRFQGQNCLNKSSDWQRRHASSTLRTESLSAGGPVSQAAEKHLANPPSPMTSFTWRDHILQKARPSLKSTNITSSDPVVKIGYDSRPGRHLLQ